MEEDGRDNDGGGGEGEECCARRKRSREPGKVPLPLQTGPNTSSTRRHCGQKQRPAAEQEAKIGRRRTVRVTFSHCLIRS